MKLSGSRRGVAFGDSVVFKGFVFMEEGGGLECFSILVSHRNPFVLCSWPRIKPSVMV